MGFEGVNSMIRSTRGTRPVWYYLVDIVEAYKKLHLATSTKPIR